MPDRRPWDAERKLLDRIASSYHGGTGIVYLYTLIKPCKYCVPNAIDAFRKQESGIALACAYGPYDTEPPKLAGDVLRENFAARGTTIAGFC